MILIHSIGFLYCTNKTNFATKKLSSREVTVRDTEVTRERHTDVRSLVSQPYAQPSIQQETKKWPSFCSRCARPVNSNEVYYGQVETI